MASNGQGDQGLQGGWAVDDHGNITFTHSLAKQLTFIQGAGAGWVRLNFRLGACFQDWTSTWCSGKTGRDTYRQLMQQILASNLQILGVIANESWHGGQQDWTANNVEHNPDVNGENDYIDVFAESAAGVLVAAFPEISQWEVWNEPNAWTSSPGPGVYTGGTFIYPSNFAQLLSQSYAAIKAANSTATVLSGGLFCHDRDNGVQYLSSTYQMGTSHAGWSAGSYPFDEVGQHLYIDQSVTTSTSRISTFFQQLRNAYLAYEGADSGKGTQITEVGWTTQQVSPAVQAQNLQIAYQTFQQTAYLNRAYWFSVQDVPEGHLFFGLVDTHGTHKPAFAAYQQDATY